ncbi:hypothetical protein BC834DRAFT_850125 [Gloeopeniophorella convolvens]|nr:hypothetical protein BC834DRAFT_850125 [Gloeopeniophorella convolvens]
MDELVHHCLRELAFDGDLGCHPSRLRDFVAGFHSDSQHQQTINDAYFTFVWSLVVRQPTVRVGTVPDGATTEVYIAPQQSQKRKSKKKETGDTPSVTSLELLPDAKSRPLDDLRLQHGHALRIAVDSDTSFAAITGSHIRPPKLTPMVYTALQFITRGREDGISTVDLGKKTGYDQKTCFYLIKQLLELELVVKLRRGGVGTNFCVHRYFFERNSLWRQIQDEGIDSSQKLQTEEGLAEDESAVSAQDPSRAPIQFDPIDARHLSSLPLIRSRIVKLLKNSKSHTHPSQNLLVTIGFSDPTKTDRRFFQSRLRELIESRIVERVAVPSQSRSASGSIPCIRLVSEENDPGTPVGGEDEPPAIPAEAGPDEPLPTVKLNITLHKQTIDLLEYAGTRGMTLNEISEALGNFDKRTLELLLTKLEKVPPPSHLAHLRVAQLMETHGRERRWRYFTVASYRAIIANEKLDDHDSPYSSVDFSNVGGFTPLAAEEFYSDVTELNHLMDYGFARPGKAKVEEKDRKRKSATPSGSGGKKRKRGEVEGGLDADGSVPPPPRKRGRPRKHPPEEDQQRAADAAEPKSSLPRKKGRSQKGPNKATVEIEAPEGAGEEPQQNFQPDHPSPLPEVPKKRQRKQNKHDDVSAPPEPPPPKKRGRSRKRPPSPPLTSVPVAHVPPPSSASVHPPGDGDATPPAPHGPAAPPDSTLSDASPAHPPPEARISEDNIDPSLLTATAPSRTASTTVGRPEASTLPRPPEPVIDPVLLPAPPPNDSGIQKNPVLPREDTGIVGSAASRMSMGPHDRKGKAPSAQSRSNVSLLRRESEFLSILDQSQGIVHSGSKEFLDAHLALLESLASAGEPTSGLPGIRVDKRTVENTFESLERRSKVKVLKTAITTPTGAQRPARIVHLPSVEQPLINAFLAKLGDVPQGVPFSVARPTTASDAPGEVRSTRPAQPLRLLRMEQRQDSLGKWSKNSDRANQLFESDDQTIHDALLTEKTTLSQFYGFVPGKMMRARELHLHTLRMLESTTHSPIVISAAERVVNFPQFLQALPIGLYCSLVSTLVRNDELTQLLSTEEGQLTQLKDLPRYIQTLLQIGRPRSRERLLELFEALRHLRLITPLQSSDSANPLIRCGLDEEGSSSFDEFTGELPPPSYRSAPDYWLLCRDAPLHLWALSSDTPPFWKSAPVHTAADASIYWNELRLACESKAFAQSAQQDGSFEPFSPDSAFARSMRREGSWSRAYDLSWHQRQYMKRFISRAGDDISLRGEDSRPVLEKVAWTISAPVSVVQDFIQKEYALRQRELEKAQKAASDKGEREGRAERVAQQKAMLARKAAEAKGRKEKEWQSIVTAVYSQPLEGAAATLVGRVRKRFLQFGMVSDRSRWEGDVLDAIQESQGATRAILPSAQRQGQGAMRPPRGRLPVAMPFAPPAIPGAPIRPAGLPPVVANQPTKTIEQLIAEQGPAREETKKKKTRKQKKGREADLRDEPADDDDEQSLRRSRFLWNKEYDELAQDASVILRARARELGGRMDWTVLRQVFPAVPRNSVRQRISNQREVQSNGVYLKRLEDQWHRLWLQYRGTEHLPDPNPQSQTDFDLVKHLHFLRSFVDKNALRVGFQESTTTFELPATVSQLHSSYKILTKPDNTPTWEFMWDSRVDESREKGLLQTSFVNELGDVPTASQMLNGSKDVQIAEAALKMVFGTPNENYDPPKAASLLRSVGEGPVSAAKDNLLNRGILSKLIRDPRKPKPGRSLKISDLNQNALGGSISQDTFQDATTLDTLCKQQDEAWREWPLLASDGDLAMLVHATSDGAVEFRIDTTEAREARKEIDWNSKKADDDHIETAIFTSFASGPDAGGTVDTQESRTLSPPPEEDNQSHGKTVDGDVACCRKYSDGLVNCEACLDSALSSWLAQSSNQERIVFQRIMGCLKVAGCAGLSASALLAKFADIEAAGSALSVIDSLMDHSTPLVVRVGHAQLLFVSAHQSEPWTVTVSEDPRTNLLPRRWLDVKGRKVQETWRAALRAVMGTIVYRPGISQAEITWRLRSVYDRAEIVDVLRHLYDEGYVQRRVKERVYEVGLVPVEEKEERAVFWMLGDRRWYQAGE